MKGIGTSNSGWNSKSKEIKCWGCNGSHFFRNFPHNPNMKMAPVIMLHESSTVHYITRHIRRNNVTLEDQQEYHQSTMLQVEGKILNTHVSILIDSGASLSYIAPRVVYKCKHFKEKQKNAWLVQLAAGLKRKVT